MTEFVDVGVGRQRMYKALKDWITEVTKHKRIVKERRTELADRWATDEQRDEVKRKYEEQYPDINFGRPLAPRLFLKATQGIGKTDAVCGRDGTFHRLLANNVGKLLAVAPSHKLAKEFYDKFVLFGDNRDIFHYRGRDQVAVDYDSDGVPTERATGEAMCKIPDLARSMHKAGIDVTFSWCMKKGMCPYAGSCDWLHQRDEVTMAPIVVATHESLYTPIIGNPKFDVAFIDEELRDIMPAQKVEILIGTPGLTSSIEFSEEFLEQQSDSEHQRQAVRDISFLQHQLALIFRDNAGSGKLLKALRSANLDIKKLRLCSTFLQDYKRVLQSEVLARIAKEEVANPAKLTAKGQEHIKELTNIPYTQIAAIFELVVLELRNEVEDECTSLYTRIQDGDFGVGHYVGGSRWLKPRNLTSSMAVLHADGTGDAEIVRETLGEHVTTVEINVKRNVVATLVRNANYSITSLSKHYKGQERKFNELQDITEREQFDAVISHIEPTRAMALRYPNSVWEEAHVRELHFKKLRGRNDYEDCRNLGIFSMPQPPVYVVEWKARAIALHRRVRFTPIPHKNDGYPDTRFYPTRPIDVVISNRKYRINVHYHPDPIGELVRYQLCEKEVVQAIDRIRGINAAETKQVALFANAVIPEVEWTETVRYHDFVQRGFTRVDHTLHLLGVLPLSPRLWIRMCDAIASEVFETIVNKDNTSQIEIQKLRSEQFGLATELEHCHVAELGKHPTQEGMFEYLVCLDIVRPPKPALNKQYFIVHGISHDNALEKAIMQVTKIPGHYVR